LIEVNSIGWPNGSEEDFWVNFGKVEESSSWEFQELFRHSVPAGFYIMSLLEEL